MMENSFEELFSIAVFSITMFELNTNEQQDKKK